MRTLLWLLLCLVVPTTSAHASLTLDALIRQHGFAADAVAVVVEDLASGRRLVEHRPAEPGLPASAMKLATAIGALAALGPEHRFATRLLASGGVAATVDEGRLAGDLVLQGDGDPLLDIDGLMALAWDLRQSGIRAVEGRFLVDDSRLPRLSVINADQPVEAGYNAGIGALSLAFNRVQRAAGAGFTIPVLRERGPAWRRLPLDQPAVVPVQDTGLHTAHVFRDLAAALGISLPEPERAAAAPSGRLVGEVRSRPLRDIVQLMLLHSNNQIAEIVGLAATGAASLDASATILSGDLSRALPGVDWRGFAMANHSGLDPTARASADQLLAILRHAETAHDILPLLPVAAWSGSLERRFRSADAALRIWAKTGSLDFASALVGYVLPPSGEPVRIALLIQDEEGRRQRDAVEAPTAAQRRAIDDFANRARELRDAIAVWALTLQ